MASDIDPATDPLGAAMSLPFVPDAATDPLGAAMKLPAGKLIPSETPGSTGGLSLEHHLATRLKQERPWETVAPELDKAGVKSEDYRQQYQLDTARAMQKGEGAGGTLEVFGREYSPFSGITRQVLDTRYTDALKRFKEGKATEEDAGTIARWERVSGLKADLGSSFAGKAVQTLGKIGEIVGEAAATGPLVGKVPGGYLARQAVATPLMPSLYQERAAAKNIEEGRSASDIRGFPSAIGLAYAQNLVLGKLPNAGAGVPGGLIPRSLASGAGGTAALSGIDVAAGVADEFLPKAYQTETKYGTVGKLLGIGQKQDVRGAMEDATLGVLGFALFAGLHDQGPQQRQKPGLVPTAGEFRPQGNELPPGPAPRTPSDNGIMDSFRDAVDYMNRRGMSKEAAGKAILDIRGRFDALLKENPNAGPEEARALFEKDPPGPLRKFAETMADALPTTTQAREVPRPELAPGTPEGPPKVVVTEGNPQETGRMEGSDTVSLPPAAEIAPGLSPAAPPAGLAESPVAPPIAPPVTPQQGKANHLARARASQAARGPIPVPENPAVNPGVTKGGKAVPYVPYEPAPPEAAYSYEHDLRGKITAAKTLNYKEKAALHGVMDESLRSLEDKLGFSQEGIRGQANRAIEKLKMEHPAEFSRFEDADHLVKEVAKENARVARERALGIANGEFHVDDIKQMVGDERVKSAAGKFLAHEEEQNKAVDKLLKQYRKETKNGRRTLSGKREQWFESQFAKVVEKGSVAPDRKSAADQEPAVVPRAGTRSEAKPAEVGSPAPAQPAKAKLTPEELAAVRRRNLFKPDTLIGRLVKGGGINPQSAENAGIDLGRMKDGPVKRLFKNGGRHIDDVINELKDSGDLPRNVESSHLADVLMEKLETGALAADQGMDVHNEKALAAEDKKRQAEEKERRDSMSPEERDAEDQAKHDAAELAKENPSIDPDFEAHLSDAFDPASFDSEPLDIKSVEAVADGVVKRFGGKKGRKGAISIDFTNVEDAIRAGVDEWSKLRGQQFPETVRVNEPVADRMATLVSAKACAEAATEFVLQAIFGNTPHVQQAKLYSAFIESRLQYMKSHGANAISIIGPDSPIQSNAEFVQIVRSPEFKEFLKRWVAIEVPIMNKHYRDAQGLAPNAPIHSASQIPGFPINLVRVRADGSPTAVGAGGLKPGRVTQRRLGFSKKASGESQTGYETDPRKALMTAHEQGAQAAARANLDREIVAQKQGEWGVPGKPRPTMMGGDPMVPVPHVNPEHGTQVASPRENTLYLNPKIMDNYLNAIQIGSSFRIPVVTPALQAMTKVAIASTVEAAYHSFNLIKNLGQPYVIRNIASEVFNYVKPLLKGEIPHLSDEQLKRYMDIAELGGTKEKGFQSGQLIPESILEKYPRAKYADPTRYMGHFLDVTDKLMRLAMDGAFEHAAKAGLAENTPRNKRDFLNTLGNYKQWSQAMLVRILRGTGFGPFATASINSPIQAIRSLWASSGMTAISIPAQAQLRGHVLLKLAAAYGASQLLNWLLWGRPDGDDNTPWGATKVGESKGRTYYVDPMRLLGPRRGLRVTGAEGVIEGNRVGASNEAILHKSATDVTESFIHPAAGPGVQFAYTTMKGKNIMGTNLAGSPDAGVPVEWENFKAAMKNANPTLAQLMLADRVKPGEKMPLFPLFGRKSSEDDVLVGKYPAETPFEVGASKLVAPYIGSRKQIGAAQLKGMMENEAKQHRTIPVR